MSSAIAAWLFLCAPRAACFAGGSLSIPRRRRKTDDADAMKFLKAIPPTFSLAEIERLAATHFGLAGEISPLYSERDQNLRLREATGAEWVLKIASIEEDPAVVDCQVGAMRHIERTDPTLPVPRVRRSRDGKDVVMVPDGKGAQHCFYVLSFLKGDMSEKHPIDAALIEQVGRTVARLALAMRGFFHPAAGNRDLLWDLRMAPRYLEHVDKLSRPEYRSTAREVLTGLIERVLPRLDGLRSQIIHGDLHPQNLIVDPDAPSRIAGLIDFGDMLHASIAQDIGHLAGDFLMSPESAVDDLACVVRGYHGMLPLEPAEIDLVFDLTLGRAVLSPLINRYRQAETPDNLGYLQVYGETMLDRMIALREVGRAEVTRRLQQECRPASGAMTVGRPPIGALLARRKRLMGDVYLFYDPPLHMVRGEGMWLIDSEGRRYIDAYNNVPHVGHCHPHVVEAIQRQVATLNTNTRYLGTQVLEYAERLAGTMTGKLTACAFVNSGSEANDLAWRMAKAYTGNGGGLAMEFAYHGITEAAHGFSPSGEHQPKAPPHIRTLMPPDDYRGPHKRGEGDLAERYAADADRAIASLAAAGLKPAAFMVDSAFMTNGMLEAPAGYLADVVDKLRAAGGLLIADEVQSGFGRMGRFMWGHRHHGVQPDFVTIGKPAGNGHPIGVVVTTAEIMARFQREVAFFSTYGGNNASCAAGLAVLDVIEREGLVANAERTGAYLKRGLSALMDRHELIGDVRGVGLAIGVELVLDRKTLAPAPAETRKLISLVRDEGVLVGIEGALGNIVKVRPPVVCRPEHAEIIVHAMDRALNRLEALRPARRASAGE
jgi:4-aminobutyrate aminotransferase-like enzyme/Ser/Thr protein kinase RdoA (MazF antagonist)